MISHRVERHHDKLCVTLELDLPEAIQGLQEDSPYAAELTRYCERHIVPDVLDVTRILIEEDEELGTVKWFSDERGYGFIRSYDDRDVFVHYSGIVGEGYRTLQQGQRVRFKRREGRQTISAVDVAPLGPEEP